MNNKKAQHHIDKLTSINFDCCWNCAYTEIVGVNSLRIGAKCKLNNRKTFYSYHVKSELLKKCCDNYKPVR